MADILSFSQQGDGDYFHQISNVLQQLIFKVIGAQTNSAIPYLYASYGNGKPHLLFSCEFSDAFNIPNWETNIICFLNAVKTFLARNSTIGKISFLTFRKTDISHQKPRNDLLQQNLLSLIFKPDFCLIAESKASEKFLSELNIGGLGNIIINLTATQSPDNKLSHPLTFSTPIHNLLALLYKLKNNLLDNGTDTFSPSTLNIISLTAHAKKIFETPKTAKTKIHIRYNTSITPQEIVSRMQNDINFTAGNFSFTTQLISQPYLSIPSASLEILKNALEPKNSDKVQITTDCTSELSSFIKDLCPFAELNISLEEMHHTSIQKKLQETYLNFLSDFMSQKEFNQQTSNF